MGKGNGQAQCRQGFANGFKHAPDQRRRHAGGNHRLGPICQIGVEEARQKLILLWCDLTQCLRAVQRQRRRLPVARTGQTEDARGQCGRQLGGRGHLLAGGIFGAGQQRDVKAAAEEIGRRRPGQRGQGQRLIQRPHRQKFVHPCEQQHPATATVNGRLGLGQKQRQQQTLQGGQGVRALRRQHARDVFGPGKPPEPMRQSRPGRGQEPHTIGRRFAQHRCRHRPRGGAACDRRLIRQFLQQGHR